MGGTQELGGGRVLRVKEDRGCSADPDPPRGLCQAICLATCNGTWEATPSIAALICWPHQYRKKGVCIFPIQNIQQLSAVL